MYDGDRTSGTIWLILGIINIILKYANIENDYAWDVSVLGHMGLCDLSRQSPIFSAMFSGGFQKINARIQLDTLNNDCLKLIGENTLWD